MHGQLTARSTPDVCRELAEAGATGVLYIAGARAGGRLVFDRGRLVAADSPTPGSRLGDRLVNGGLLDEDTLHEVLEEQRATPVADRVGLGRLLIDRGLVPADAVRVVVQEQVLDAVFDLARWRHGEYRFEADAEAEPSEVPLSVSVDQALVEVARRWTEWEALSEAIPDLDAVPRAHADAATASLEPDGAAVLRGIDGSRSVRDLAYDLGYGEFEAARIVYALHLAGVVEVSPPRDEIGAALDDALSYVGDQPDDAGGTSPGATPEAEVSEDDRGGGDHEAARARAEPGAGGAEGGPHAPTPAAADADVDEGFDDSIFDQLWPEEAGGDDRTEEAGGRRPEEAGGADRPEQEAARHPADVERDAGVDDGAGTAPPEERSAEHSDLTGFEELRLAERDRHPEEALPPPPSPAEPEAAAPQRTPRTPSPGARADVSEFLRELSRLALEEEAEDAEHQQPEPSDPGADPPPRTRPPEPREEPKRKKRGLFGFGG